MATAEPAQNGAAEAATDPLATSNHVPETEVDTDTATATATATATTPPEKKWPGWPGDCVFRLIVPSGKVGSIIGRKGELIKKICDETRARIRVLDAPVGTPDRIVLISGKEEREATLSPAMDAVIRVFKRVSGLSETDAENNESAGSTFCSIRLLVASSQALNLIGKQGTQIKSIQESTSATIRVLSGDEVQSLSTEDERIVELQGEGFKVLKALEAVVAHLRKFLVDHSVLPLFEKTNNAPISKDRQAEILSDKSMMHTTSQASIFADIPLSTKRDSVFADRESQLDSLFPSSALSIYGQDSSLSGVRSSSLSRIGPPIVTTVIQRMQIPLSYAEDIIGIQGANIDYIRRASGAILTVQESRVPDEIIVEVKGSSSDVQMAQQLIQEVISNHQEAAISSYGRLDAGLRSSYSQLGVTSRFSSSLSSQPPYTGYGASGTGDYSTFRL